MPEKLVVSYPNIMLIWAVTIQLRKRNGVIFSNTSLHVLRLEGFLDGVALTTSLPEPAMFSDNVVKRVNGIVCTKT